MKKLALKLKSDPQSRCSNLSICVDQVKSSLSVMIHVQNLKSFIL